MKRRKLSLGECSTTASPHRTHAFDRIGSALTLTSLGITPAEATFLKLEPPFLKGEDVYESLAGVSREFNRKALFVTYSSDGLSFSRCMDETGIMTDVVGDHPWGLVKVWTLPKYALTAYAETETDTDTETDTHTRTRPPLEQAFDQERANVAHFVARYQRLQRCARGLSCKVIVFMRTHCAEVQYCFMVMCHGEENASYEGYMPSDVKLNWHRVLKGVGWQSLDDLEECLHFVRDALEGAKLVKREQEFTVRT